LILKLTTDIEDNVDAIRDAIYEEIKDMTSEERTAYYNAIAEEARKKYNLCVIPSAKGMAAAAHH
jgi:vacuolar-type H+-ATPase subunit E/Vma4